MENVEGSSKSANNSNKNRSRSGTDADTDGVETIDLTTQPWKKQASWFHDRMIIKDFKR